MTTTDSISFGYQDWVKATGGRVVNNSANIMSSQSLFMPQPQNLYTGFGMSGYAMPMPYPVSSYLPQVPISTPTVVVNNEGEFVANDNTNVENQEEEIELNISYEDREELQENLENSMINNKKAEVGTLGATILGGCAFMPGAFYKSGSKNNEKAIELLYSLNESHKGAKYGHLFKEHPRQMLALQEELSKYTRQYQRRCNALEKAGNKSALSKLQDDYYKVIDLVEKSLTSGKPKELAEITAKLNSANAGIILNRKNNYKNLAKNGKTKFELMDKADVSKAKLLKGNKLRHHFGGWLGALMSLGFMAGAILNDRAKLKEAKAYDKEHGTSTYKDQLKVTGVKVLASSSFFLADGVCKYGVAKYVSKNSGKVALRAAGKVATKIATKVGIKAGCKALGLVLGSAIPFVGPILGMAVGYALDWGIRKIMAKKLDPIESAKNKQMSNKDLLTQAYIDKLSGKEISYKTERILANNPAFCAKMDELIAQQQAQEQAEQQAMMEQQQLAMAEKQAAKEAKRAKKNVA